MASFDATEPAFPNNVVQLISDRVGLKWDNVIPVMRPLRKTDPNFTVAIFGALWTPDGESVEFVGGQPGPTRPTIERYACSIQVLVKNMDEVEGLAQSSALSEEVRTMLYADEPLRVGLVALTTSVGGVTKSFRKYSVGTQRYLSNEINGEFIYMSTLEFTFETETR